MAGDQAQLAMADDLAAWLDERLSKEEQEVAADLLRATEQALERETGLTFRPAETVTDEPHNGRGTRSVRLDREVADLRASGSVLKIGNDPANPDETVDLTDVDEAVLDPDSARRIHTRVTVLPVGVGNIHVTYNAAEMLPDLARQAVLEVAAATWQRRGSEGLESARLGRAFQFKLARDAREMSDSWKLATERLYVPVLG